MSSVRIDGEVFGHLINISGRQRMLSQRLILLIVVAQSGDSKSLELAEGVLKLFSDSHIQLTEGGAGSPGLFCDDIKDAFFGKSNSDSIIRNFISNANLAIHSVKTGSSNDSTIDDLVSSSSDILSTLNAITIVYEQQSKLFSTGVEKELIANGQRLAVLLKKIGRVVKEAKMISINLTIEAARAGDAGSQFKVVSYELKSMTQNIDEIIQSALETIRE